MKSFENTKGNRRGPGRNRIDPTEKVATLVTQFAEDRQTWQGAVVPPIYQNSLFTFPDLESIDRAFSNPVESAIYTRGRNPSVQIAESKIAALSKGEKAKLFGSGMAAISSAVLHFVRAGDHIVTIRNLYGPAHQFVRDYLGRKFDISTTFLDGRDPEEFRRAIQKNTRLIYLESPSSVVFSLQDIRAIAGIAQQNGIPTVIDNTWATPLFQKPLEMGIDLEIHSVSKYLGGHSDLVAGAVVGKAEMVDRIYLREHALLGGKMAPFEGWLLTRSLRTFPLRMRLHQETALQVARFLEQHPKVKEVYYPGLRSHPQYSLSRRQMTGYSGLMSFCLSAESEEIVARFVNHLRIFQIGVSWGGHESLVFPPGLALQKEFPADQFQKMGIPLSLIRISIGLEDSGDLVTDLDQALQAT